MGHLTKNARGWTLLFDPVASRWAEMGSGDVATSTGRCWTLLEDGSVLKNSTPVQRYVPGDGRWRSITDSPLPAPAAAGPAILLPDGRVWVVARPFDAPAPSRSYFYHPASDRHPDRWRKRPDYRKKLRQAFPHMITMLVCFLAAEFYGPCPSPQDPVLGRKFTNSIPLRQKEHQEDGSDLFASFQDPLLTMLGFR
jgi:hypothetical protein